MSFSVHLATRLQLLAFDVFFSLKQTAFRKRCSSTLNNQVRRSHPHLQEFLCYWSSQARKAFWKFCSGNTYFYVAAAALELPKRLCLLLCLWNESAWTRASEPLSSSFNNRRISPHGSPQTFALNIITNVHMHHRQAAVPLDITDFVLGTVNTLMTSQLKKGLTVALASTKYIYLFVAYQRLGSQVQISFRKHTLFCSSVLFLQISKWLHVKPVRTQTKDTNHTTPAMPAVPSQNQRTGSLLWEDAEVPVSWKLPASALKIWKETKKGTFKTLDANQWVSLKIQI